MHFRNIQGKSCHTDLGLYCLFINEITVIETAFHKGPPPIEEKHSNVCEGTLLTIGTYDPSVFLKDEMKKEFGKFPISSITNKQGRTIPIFMFARQEIPEVAAQLLFDKLKFVVKPSQFRAVSSFGQNVANGVQSLFTEFKPTQPVEYIRTAMIATSKEAIEMNAQKQMPDDVDLYLYISEPQEVKFYLKPSSSEITTRGTEPGTKLKHWLLLQRERKNVYPRQFCITDGKTDPERWLGLNNFQEDVYVKMDDLKKKRMALRSQAFNAYREFKALLHSDRPVCNFQVQCRLFQEMSACMHKETSSPFLEGDPVVDISSALHVLGVPAIHSLSQEENVYVYLPRNFDVPARTVFCIQLDQVELQTGEIENAVFNVRLTSGDLWEVQAFAGMFHRAFHWFGLVYNKKRRVWQYFDDLLSEVPELEIDCQSYILRNSTVLLCASRSDFEGYPFLSKESSHAAFTTNDQNIESELARFKLQRKHMKGNGENFKSLDLEREYNAIYDVDTNIRWPQPGALNLCSPSWFSAGLLEFDDTAQR